MPTHSGAFRGDTRGGPHSKCRQPWKACVGWFRELIWQPLCRTTSCCCNSVRKLHPWEEFQTMLTSTHYLTRLVWEEVDCRKWKKLTGYDFVRVGVLKKMKRCTNALEKYLHPRMWQSLYPAQIHLPGFRERWKSQLESRRWWRRIFMRPVRNELLISCLHTWEFYARRRGYTPYPIARGCRKRRCS